MLIPLWFFTYSPLRKLPPLALSANEWCLFAQVVDRKYMKRANLYDTRNITCVLLETTNYR